MKKLTARKLKAFGADYRRKYHPKKEWTKDEEEVLLGLIEQGLMGPSGAQYILENPELAQRFPDRTCNSLARKLGELRREKTKKD